MFGCPPPTIDLALSTPEQSNHFLSPRPPVVRSEHLWPPPSSRKPLFCHSPSPVPLPPRFTAHPGDLRSGDSPLGCLEERLHAHSELLLCAERLLKPLDAPQDLVVLDARRGAQAGELAMLLMLLPDRAVPSLLGFEEVVDSVHLLIVEVLLRNEDPETEEA
eukprot:CAMPEP_0181299318 /NCGR_PEP_ID=MMETSP1101-20121128/6280_1 /TAXON_ID=46948 /ORGANISM="Rhodomonas abbreviata, Strain Caron Lab Isolate" /LENGTH=161 /DNA_ID=CAMNT_0023404455 /DNA_START=238 /DNA_END=724 /DNA_ORIENTATION=+